jgi:biotin carboxyl carrier protein
MPSRLATPTIAGRATAYAVSVGDREYHVEVQGSHLFVDGERLEFELTSLNGNGLHLFRQGARSTEMYLKTVSDSDWEIHVHGRTVTAQVDSAHCARRRNRAAQAAGDITAPMPGLVVDVQVVAGQTVEQGDVLLVQESMKMQMLLRAPFRGRVGSVRVAAGAQVDKGALLVQLTEEPTVGGTEELVCGGGM